MPSPMTTPFPTPLLPAAPARRRVPRFFIRMAALVAASTLLLTGPVSTATAHDELASSSPADKASIDVTPDEIVLTFANPPSGIGAGIIVSDSTGTNWSEGPATVLNNTAIQPLKSGAPAGTYTAQWRVVSSDDHPIEGTLSFTRTSAQPVAPQTGSPQTEATGNPGSPATYVLSPDSESSPVPEPTQEPSGATGPDAASPQASDPAGSSTGLPAFVIYFSLGGALVAVVLALVTRWNLKKK